MNISKPSFALLILVSSFILRGLFLEYTDLIDPTEARYASVAQEMLLTNDWLTPKLPMPEGVIPYLGKPPLHFWATALSYKLFGFEEWSARLPSLIATALILLSVFYFVRKFFDNQTAIIAALVTFSSALMFFLSGASVTDVTLTAMLTISTVSLYSYLIEANTKSFLIAIISAALAFLCKGPVAIVLIALPFILWSLAQRNFSWLKTFPWVRAILILSAIILPWFIAAERANPGFIKYFVWNENIARYLFKDYGDLYGSGHVHTYGMSWLMLFAAFMPWTVVPLIALYREGIKKSWYWLKSNPTLLFVFFWSISAGLFFTFVRQLHAMYLLPSIPALGILTARIFTVTEKQYHFAINRFSQIAIVSSWLTIVALGAILYFNPYSSLLAVVLSAAGMTIVLQSGRHKTKEIFVGVVAALAICTYLVTLVATTPYMNIRRSSEEALKFLVAQTKNDQNIPHVGVFTRNSYSHYWTSNAWENELGRRVGVHYLSPENRIPEEIDFLLLKSDKSTPQKDKIFFNRIFTIAFQGGEWLLYREQANT